jgi:hypothetical protein
VQPRTPHIEDTRALAVAGLAIHTTTAAAVNTPAETKPAVEMLPAVVARVHVLAACSSPHGLGTGHTLFALSRCVAEISPAMAPTPTATSAVPPNA